MADRKDEARAQDEKRDPSEYYLLKKKAVEDLVSADESNSPKVSREEIAKYTRKPFGISLVPGWGKVLFVKFWFQAAVCFFFVWGLGGYIGSLLDQLFVIGLAMGLVTDLLVNNALRFMAVQAGDNDRWMLFPKKGYMSFLLNILYGFVMIFFVYTIYNMVNLAWMYLSGEQNTLLLSVEPILFGLFGMGVDMMFVSMKNIFLRILADAKHSAGSKTK